MPTIQWRKREIAFPSYAGLAEQHKYGRPWYHESGQALDAYADSIGVPFGYACDVLAILSPRVSVAQNVKLARSYLETGRAPGAMRQRLEALARYEARGLLTGPKVTAFSRALQGDNQACVIDAHLFRLFSVDGRDNKAYLSASATLARVAASLGWPIAETQAALWCGVRSLCGFSDNYSPLRFDHA